jgi:hypothetical protein
VSQSAAPSVSGLDSGAFGDYLYSEPLDVPNVFFCTCIALFMIRGILRCWREDREHALPYILLITLFPLPYYLTHSSMDYRQPIEPEIIILVTIGIFGFRDWTSSSDFRELEEFGQSQPAVQLVYASALGTSDER